MKNSEMAETSVESFELVALKTGVTSLRSLGNRETFHPVTGPAIEAQILHVDQQKLVSRAEETSDCFVVWDVGLGAAANALAVVKALSSTRHPVELHSFDRTTGPLEFALKHVRSLGYLSGYEELLKNLLKARSVQINPLFHWHFHLGDFRDQLAQSSDLPAPHAILYDPYSSTTNPEMWSLEHFGRIYQRLSPSRPCLLTNYTRSTAVRISLLLAGFSVGIGCEVGEKAETTIASNAPELLERPLDRRWLERVRLSRNSAPLRMDRFKGQANRTISLDDFERLQALPQFRS